MAAENATGYYLVQVVYFDVTAEPPGAVATTFADLVDLFRTDAVRSDAATKAREHFRGRFCALDDGHAAERVSLPLLRLPVGGREHSQDMQLGHGRQATPRPAPA